MFGTLARPRRAARRPARARHAADHGPRRQPHLRRAPVVRRVALLQGQPQARLVLVARAAQQLDLGVLGLGVGARRGDGRALPARVLAQAARPQLGEPGGPRGRLLDDELVAGPRGRRLPHGRHQHHLQGRPALPDGATGEAAGGEPAASTTSAGRGSTSSCRRCTARSSPAATRCSTWARCRASRSRRRSSSPTPRATSSTWSSSSSTSTSTRHGTKWNSFPLDLRDLKRSFGRWQEGLAETGWNTLYWNNHDQPRIVSRWGDDGEHRVRSAKALGTLLHLHRGTPYVYQGEELGMTNVPFGSIEDFRDIESLNHYAEAVADGEDPEAVLASMRPMNRDNARTPMQWDDSPHAGFTTRRAVDRRQPEPRRDQRGRGDRRPRLGLPPLPAADRAAPRRAGGRARRLHDAARGRPARLRVHARARRHRAARGGQRLRRARERRRRPGRRGVGGRGARAHERRARSRTGSSSAPWEARVYRRSADLAAGIRHMPIASGSSDPERGGRGDAAPTRSPLSTSSIIGDSVCELSSQPRAPCRNDERADDRPADRQHEVEDDRRRGGEQRRAERDPAEHRERHVERRSWQNDRALDVPRAGGSAARRPRSPRRPRARANATRHHTTPASSLAATTRERRGTSANVICAVRCDHSEETSRIADDRQQDAGGLDRRRRAAISNVWSASSPTDRDQRPRRRP